MPKRLQEIRNLNGGTVLNVDEKDSPQDSSTYAVNVNPSSQEGVLEGIKSDKMLFSLKEGFEIISPMYHGQNSLKAGSQNANSGNMKISNIHLFENMERTDIGVEGTYGVNEKLTITGLSPTLNEYRIGQDEGGNNFELGAASYKFASSLSATDDTITAIDNNYTITEDCADTEAVFTNFVDGVATITLKTNVDVATTKTNLNGKIFTIKTPDNLEKTYQFVGADNQYATGGAIGAGAVVINITDRASLVEMAEETCKALSYKKQYAGPSPGARIPGSPSTGHSFRLMCEVDSTNAAEPVITITMLQPILSDILSEGVYFILFNQAGSLSSFSGRSSHEIIKVVETSGNNITIQRGMFETTPLAYSNSNRYSLFANYIISDRKMYLTNEGFANNVWNWSSLKGNNVIGGSSFELGGANHYWAPTGTLNSTTRRYLGKIESVPVTFNSADKSITAAGIGNIWWGPGDKITLYYTGATDNANTGKTFTIETKSTNKITVKEPIISNDNTTVTTGGSILYIEGGLIKNGSFSHSLNSDSNASSINKVDDWRTSNYYNNLNSNTEGYDPIVRNYYEDDSQTVSGDDGNAGPYVAKVASQGVPLDSRNIIGANLNASDSYYPFDSAKPAIEIKSAALRTTCGAISLPAWKTRTLSATDTVLTVDDAICNKAFNVGDILYLKTAAGEEYVKVIGLTENTITFERGLFGTTALSHTFESYTSMSLGDKGVYHNIKSNVYQTVSKNDLIENQAYELTFYMKSDGTQHAKGYVAIELNDGYMTKDGAVITNKDINKGYHTEGNPSGTDISYSMEDKWISTELLIPEYEDEALELSNTYKKYKLVLNLAQNTKYNTDLKISFASFGITNSKIYVDYVNLKPLIKGYFIEELDKLTSTSFIDYSNIRDLVVYNSYTKSISLYNNFDTLNTSFNPSSITKSVFASNTEVSSNNLFSAVPKNKELHMGFGPKTTDTKPQWLGYLNHSVFGEDFRDTLYQDEDTVRQFSDAGTFGVTKVCTAGEFEFIDSELDTSTGILTVTMPSSTPHNCAAGDNIVIREWADSTNNWSGNGVWYIIALDGTSPSSKFTCKKTTKYTGTSNNVIPVTKPVNGKICFRPYYWYGIKEGEPYIYRISPDTLIESGGTASSTYLRGTVEKGPPLNNAVRSITTCYNKAANGSQGGLVYLLNVDSGDTKSVDISIANVMIPYSKWSTESVSQFTLTYTTLPYTAPTHVSKASKFRDGSGNISDGKTSVTTTTSSTIKYAGTPSDIIETKGTTYAFNRSATSNLTNDPSKFDTRLWLQCSGTFKEGDRFVFAARTDEESNQGGGMLYGADRSPCTTLTDMGNSHGYEVENVSTGYLGLPYRGHVENNMNPHLIWTYTGSWGYNTHHGDIKRNINSDTTEFGNATAYYNTSSDDKFTWGTKYRRSRIANMGDNIGWMCKNINYNSGVSITVPKRAIARMGDNDGDGIIDGTGLVVANTESLNLTHSEGEKEGAWGREGQRVSSHCVALLGNGGGNPWIVRAGKWVGSRSSDEWDDNHAPAARGWGGATLVKSIKHAIFTCPDIHAGDLLDGAIDGRDQNMRGLDYRQGGDLFGHKIWDGNSYVGDNQMAGTQSTSTDGSYFNSVIAGSIDHSYNRYDTDNDSDDDDDDGESTSGSKYINIGSPAGNGNVFKPSNLLNYTDKFIESEICKNAPGNYTHCWWTAPSSLHQQLHDLDYSPLNDEHTDDHYDYFSNDAAGAEDQEVSTIYKNFISGNRSRNLPITSRVDRLNYRAGKVIKMLAGEDVNGNPSAIASFTNYDSATCIETTSFPEATSFIPDLNHLSSGNFRAKTAPSVGAATMTVDNGSTVIGTDAEVEALVLGRKIYTSAGLLIGLVSDVTTSGSDHTLTIYNGVQNAPADNDALKVEKLYAGNNYGTKVYVSKAFIGEENDYGFTIMSFPLEENQSDYSRHINSGIGNASGYKAVLDGNMYEPFLEGTLAGGNYTTLPGGSGILSDTLGSKYPTIRLKESEITGPTALVNDGNYNSYGLNNSGINFPDSSANSSGTTTKAWRNTDNNAGFGGTNRIVGQVLYIYEAAKYKWHSRYIVGSKFNSAGNSGDGTLNLLLHYPLNFTPASGDTFKLISHATSCVAEIQCKTSEEITNIDEDMTYIFMASAFGGLDKAKTTGLNVSNIDYTTSGTTSTLTVAPAGKNIYNPGDMIKIDSGVAAQKGSYEVTSGTDANSIVVKDTHNSNDTGYNNDYQAVTTNQTEFLIIDRSGKGGISEVRFNDVDNVNATLSEDTGDSIANFEGNNAIKYVKSASDASVILSATGGSSPSTDYFKANETYTYKMSLIYDGYQEGPLSAVSYPFTDVSSKPYVDITIRVGEHSKRLTGVCIYRKDGENNFYRLVKQHSTSSGWVLNTEENYRYKEYRDDGTSFGTYESRTGINETVTDISVKYGLSCEIDGYLFAGNCSNKSIEDASNQLFRSKPGKFSIFDWTSDFVILNSAPTAMVGFNGRLYVFDKNNLHKINQHMLNIEDTYEGVGCHNKDSLITTEKGLFFANNSGAYWHNGQNPVQISAPIWQMDEDNLWIDSSNSMFDISWSNLFKNLVDCKVTYDSGSNIALFVISSKLFDEKIKEDVVKNFIWAYSITTSRWDLWELSDSKTLGSPIVGENNEILLPMGESLYELRAGGHTKPFSFLTKKLSMGEDSITKVYNKVKINGFEGNLNTDDSSASSLLIRTSEGYVTTSDIVYVDKKEDSEYKLSGSNKKGRWVQVLIENCTSSIDSIGVIYRRKTTK